MSKKPYVLSIDPGNVESAFCIVEASGYKPVEFAKIPNEELAERLQKLSREVQCDFVIERVACYGMAVGREVFDTCEWIGRFSQIIESRFKVTPHYIFRTDEKRIICHSMNAGDPNIRRALIDRFAVHDLKTGKGTKKNPDFFYGFAKDVWAAFAVAVTYIDLQEAPYQ